MALHSFPGFSRHLPVLLALAGLAAGPLALVPAQAHQLVGAPYGQEPLYDYPYPSPSSPYGAPQPGYGYGSPGPLGGLGQLLGVSPAPGVPLSPAQQAARCNTGRLVGGLLGGGAGYAMSRKDGRAWAVPLGALLGSQVGCSAATGRGGQPW